MRKKPTTFFLFFFFSRIHYSSAFRSMNSNHKPKSFSVCGHNSFCALSLICFVCPGTRCEQKVEACLSFPCRNKAVCQNDFENLSYNCFCRPGFDGRDCENNIGKFLAFPNAHTFSLQLAFLMRRIIGFYSDDCNPDPCLNGGTCRDLTDAFECLCKTGFSGLRCDHEGTTVVVVVSNQGSSKFFSTL